MNMTAEMCARALPFAGCPAGTQWGWNKQTLACGCYSTDAFNSEALPQLPCIGCGSGSLLPGVGSQRTAPDVTGIVLLAGGVILGLFVLRGLFRFLRD